MSRSEAAETRKSRLRAHFRSRRNNLDARRAIDASSSVCQRLAARDELQDIDCLAGYMAKGHELDVRPFLDTAIDQGIEVLLPRVIGPGEMEFCPVDDWDELESGTFGIEEPTGPVSPIDDVDIFLVPGLAFDRQGTRLGFGMGYYDRALPPSGRATTVGVGYDWQLVEELPSEDHDQPMDAVVTDCRWLRVSESDASDRE